MLVSSLGEVGRFSDGRHAGNLGGGVMSRPEVRRRIKHQGVPLSVKIV
jgi:hypothetical protein